MSQERKKSDGGNRLFTTVVVVLVILNVLLGARFFLSRGSPEKVSDPEPVAEKYLEALVGYDVPVLSKLSTVKLAKSLDRLPRLFPSGGPGAKEFRRVVRVESGKGRDHSYRSAYSYKDQKNNLGIALYMVSNDGEWKIFRVKIVDSKNPGRSVVLPSAGVPRIKPPGATHPGKLPAGSPIPPASQGVTGEKHKH